MFLRKKFLDSMEGAINVLPLILEMSNHLPSLTMSLSALLYACLKVMLFGLTVT